jgi:toxin ParE1/3/4
MGRYRLTNQADLDLLDIFVYGIELFGELQAIRYQRGLNHVFELLADNPHLGREATAIGPDVRRHEHGSHIILYEESEDGVTILAFVHQSSIRRLTL